ncbi:glycosyltransferase family 4 protein [Paenibacillus sp. MMO-58]|uniref:glycosyltransferase family 4 protein n=1 Tax=Paenibacillus sp. MMO-58 TaxID=3081290 RepID=UPI003017AE57
MKIVLLIGGMVYGGAERVMANLANYLCRNNEVTLISLHEHPCEYELDVKIKFINGVNQRNPMYTAIRLRKLITKNIRADIVLSFLTHINILTIGSLVASKVPVVVSERNDPNFEPKQIHRKLLRSMLYPFASGYVFQTLGAQQYFSKKIIKKSTVIANPLFNINPPIADESMKKNEIVAVGRLTEQKNYNLLIDAFKIIHKKFPDYTVKIFGDGELREELERKINDLELNDKVFLMGTSSTILEDIRTSKIFVMTSNHEGMPNALMEALSVGLCCISTDCPCGGPGELIQDKENGLLIQVKDLDSLVNALTSVIKSDTLRVKMSNNAIQIKNHLNPNVIYEKWDSYLNSIAVNIKR